MKYLLLFLFFPWVCLSQTSEITMNTDAFKELKVYDGLSVTIQKGHTNEIKISGEATKNVVIDNDKGVLKIKMKFKKMFGGYRTFVSITHQNPFNSLDANEDSSIEVLGSITQEVLRLNTQEGAQIIASVEVDQLIVKAVSGGTVISQGTTNIQDISINTGGIYKGASLQSSFTTIEVNAGGSASIRASDYVGANVKAGGAIKVYGDPKKMDEKKLFGGSIERIKN